MRTFTTFILIVCLVGAARAQFLDLGRVEYTLVPGKNSSFDYSRSRILFNFPFKVADGKYFFAGIDYSRINVGFNQNIDVFDTSEADDFTLFDLNLTYTFPVNDDWRVAFQVSPGMSSSAEGSYFKDDLVFSSIVAFIKDKKENSNGKPYRIIIGAAYSGNSGIQFPIPFISFYKKFHRKWSYNVGAPISNLQFHASESFRMKLYATLDGFNANLQRNQVLSTNEVASRIRINMILVGTRFEYKISEHVESFLTITRSINPVVQLRENRKRIFTIKAADVMHYRLGIRFRI